MSRETGIPRSTLGFVRRGERKLPSGYQSSVRNLYEREAYRRMRETGFSRTQARRYQWYAPESIRLKESEMKLLVNRYTTGVVGMETAKLRRAGVSFDMDKLWKDAKAKIIAGLQKSKEPVETFADPDY